MYLNHLFYNRSVSNFNIILLENNKEIWRKFCISCWTVEKTTNVFNFHGCDGNSMSSNIEKSNLKINSNSSIIVSSNNCVFKIYN